MFAYLNAILIAHKSLSVVGFNESKVESSFNCKNNRHDFFIRIDSVYNLTVLKMFKLCAVLQTRAPKRINFR